MSGYGTYGVRWFRGYFYIYLMWHDPLGQRRWMWARLWARSRYRRLDNVFKSLKGAEAIMLFPPQED